MMLFEVRLSVPETRHGRSPDLIDRNFNPTAILGLNAGPYRAAEGTRLVLIEVAVQRAMVGADSAFLQQDFWELGVDGSSNSPSRVYRQASERVGEDLVTLVFIVDETFGDLNLVVAPGLDGSTKHPIAFSG